MGCRNPIFGQLFQSPALITVLGIDEENEAVLGLFEHELEDDAISIHVLLNKMPD